MRLVSLGDLILDVVVRLDGPLVPAEAAGIRGGAVTPFVLEQLHAEGGGRTFRANRKLIEYNARLAGEIVAAS